MLTMIGMMVVILFLGLILALSLRGLPGNPTSDQLSSPLWEDNGPLELSPERGRYALTYSLVTDGSFYFSVPLARFVAPDLGYHNGKYVSLFAPGVSYLVAPGFIIGGLFGLQQVGTYAVVALFSLFNVLLIQGIARRLGAHPGASLIAGMIFLFATPAFAYAVSLYQHQISTFLILASMYMLIRFKSLWALPAVWFIAALSIPVDYPNLFLMVPIGLYALGRIVSVKMMAESLQTKIKIYGFLTFATAIGPFMFFTYFNTMSYGNPFQFSGTVSTVKAVDVNGNPAVPHEIGEEDPNILLRPEKQEKSAQGFFKTRNITNGLAIHLVSRDRGVIWYTPIILLGIAGLFAMRKKQSEFVVLSTGILGVTVLLYSMWGDPWGGWAFGSRYLIPAYAVLSIPIALLMTRFRRNWYVIIALSVLFLYSVSVNTLGALTTNRIPPYVEVLALEELSGREEKYSYDRNLEMIQAGNSKSYLFQVWGYRHMDAFEYYGMVVLLIFGFYGVVLAYFYIHIPKNYGTH